MLSIPFRRNHLPDLNTIACIRPVATRTVQGSHSVARKHLAEWSKDMATLSQTTWVDWLAV
jgi:hypothetical protein